MPRHTRSDIEVGFLIYGRAISLLLTAPRHASACQFLRTSLRIVRRRVLAEDEVSAAELIHMRFPLRLRVELSS